jgi:hypothetical protein
LNANHPKSVFYFVELGGLDDGLDPSHSIPRAAHGFRQRDWPPAAPFEVAGERFREGFFDGLSMGF